MIRPDETRIDGFARRFVFIITMPIKSPVILAVFMYVTIRALLSWLFCGDHKMFSAIPFQKQIDGFFDWPL